VAHGAAAELRYNWPSTSDRLGVHFKKNGPTFVRLWMMLRFLLSAPETVNYRDQQLADHVMAHDGISFALVAVRAIPRAVYSTWARLVELVDHTESRPLIDELLVHRRIPFKDPSPYYNHPLVYLILSDYVGLPGRGMAPADVTAQDCTTLYVGQTVEVCRRMSNHLTASRRKPRSPYHCYRVGCMIDEKGKAHPRARVLCLVDFDRDCAPLIAEGHWAVTTRCLDTWEIAGINGISQRDMFIRYDNTGVVLNKVLLNARHSAGLPVRATTSVGTNTSPGFENRQCKFDHQFVWRATAEALINEGVVFRPQIDKGSAHTRFAASLFGTTEGFSVSYLQTKTGWRHCFTKNGWIRFRVVMNRRIEATRPASERVLWLEITSSDGGDALNIPYDPKCKDPHTSWVQNVLSHVYRIYFGGAF